jgi:hypothetical protein
MADLLEVADEVVEALALVRENRARLESAMSKKPGFDQAHSKAAGDLATATKMLSGESRLWAEIIRKIGEAATPEQRTAAALEHLLSLPPGPRAQAYEALAQRELSNAQRIPLTVGR